MQIQSVQNNKPIFTSSLPLRSEIVKLKNPTKEMVKDLYGTFGLDIYEGKKNLTILSENQLKKSKSLISKIRTWFTGFQLADYEEGDTLMTILSKYMHNNKSGLVKEIETKFGKKGTDALERFGLVGYVNC